MGSAGTSAPTAFSFYLVLNLLRLRFYAALLFFLFRDFCSNLLAPHLRIYEPLIADCCANLDQPVINLVGSFDHVRNFDRVNIHLGQDGGGLLGAACSLFNGGMIDDVSEQFEIEVDVR